MDGVTIISQMQVAVEDKFNWPVFWIATGIIIATGISLSILMILVEGWDIGNIGVMVAWMFIGVLTVPFPFADANPIPIKYETHYEVSLDESVDMNAFLDKYEIIDTEGKILTIRERD